MEKSIASRSGIIADGPERIRQTKEYRQQVEQIKNDIRRKYSRSLNEASFLRRCLLTFKMKVEIRRAVAALSSIKRLYIGAGPMAG